MHKKYLILALSVLFIFSSCSTNDEVELISSPNPSALNKILPLGASRVEGARPNFESYRYELWKQLVDSNYSFDFIGSTIDDASYPSHANQSFDRDHSGYGGFTSGQILSNLNQWLNQSGTPDVVLLSSPGGNDALLNLSYTQAVSNINAIVDVLQERNPNMTIIIEQIAPGRSSIMTSTLTNYMLQMQQEAINIAATKSTATSRVLTVNMFNGFNDTHLADDVHYNENGATLIASRYFTVLQNVLQ